MRRFQGAIVGEWGSGKEDEVKEVVKGEGRGDGKRWMG